MRVLVAQVSWPYPIPHRALQLVPAYLPRVFINADLYTPSISGEEMLQLLFMHQMD
jgi:hypothetical protein